jgi:hypothetical protein
MLRKERLEIIFTNYLNIILYVNNFSGVLEKYK